MLLHKLCRPELVRIAADVLKFLISENLLIN